MTKLERKRNSPPKRPSSMQKYVYYAVAIVIAIVLYAFQSPQRLAKKTVETPMTIDSTTPPTPPSASTNTPTNPSVNPPDAIDDSEIASASPALTPKPTPKAKRSVVQSLPKIDLIREEVKKDPHSPPPSGALFAMDLAARMEQAETSKDLAEKLFTELEECGGNRDASLGVPSMKALCIQSARDLVKKYPEFQTRYDEMRKKADPRAASIADQIP